MSGFPEERFVAPEVIGGEFTGWESEVEQVCVPAMMIGEEVLFELRRTDDGRIELTVYSTPEELVRCRGPRQPWIGIRTDALDECAAVCGADVVLWDEPVLVEQVAQ